MFSCIVTSTEDEWIAEFCLTFKPLPPPLTLTPQGFVLDNENGSKRYKWH